MKTLIALMLATAPALADTVLPTRVIRAREIIGAGDVTVDPGHVEGAASTLEAVVGREARIALYPGRPIRPGDVTTPAIVERNDLVTLRFSAGGLRISTEGRVLARGAVGDRIRVMNLSSRQSVMGRVLSDGTVEVE